MGCCRRLSVYVAITCAVTPVTIPIWLPSLQRYELLQISPLPGAARVNFPAKTCADSRPLEDGNTTGLQIMAIGFRDEAAASLQLGLQRLGLRAYGAHDQAFAMQNYHWSKWLHGSAGRSQAAALRGCKVTAWVPGFFDWEWREAYARSPGVRVVVPADLAPRPDVGSWELFARSFFEALVTSSARILPYGLIVRLGDGAVDKYAAEGGPPILSGRQMPFSMAFFTVVYLTSAVLPSLRGVAAGKARGPADSQTAAAVMQGSIESLVKPADLFRFDSQQGSFGELCRILDMKGDNCPTQEPWPKGGFGGKVLGAGGPDTPYDIYVICSVFHLINWFLLYVAEQLWSRWRPRWPLAPSSGRARMPRTGAPMSGEKKTA
eukprot:gnl/TRDRNA2_/TRDRNA2_42270_c0_seq1.p1 gnl/TRDRNA2_/TRDRNA2_42270_c0~~gnl/TRDRNA2_/TRDRNA2_42270_c0_seq1.p1  ORF type:complete len:393 (+),score=34.68 gnl/TRDRNA2_/TRDRNA2_42270_c0_seq1:50-1180(+)